MIFRRETRSTTSVQRIGIAVSSHIRSNRPPCEVALTSPFQSKEIDYQIKQFRWKKGKFLSVWRNLVLGPQSIVTTTIWSHRFVAPWAATPSEFDSVMPFFARAELYTNGSGERGVAQALKNPAANGANARKHPKPPAAQIHRPFSRFVLFSAFCNCPPEDRARHGDCLIKFFRSHSGRGLIAIDPVW